MNFPLPGERQTIHSSDLSPDLPALEGPSDVARGAGRGDSFDSDGVAIGGVARLPVHPIRKLEERVVALESRVKVLQAQMKAIIALGIVGSDIDIDTPDNFMRGVR